MLQWQPCVPSALISVEPWAHQMAYNLIDCLGKGIHIALCQGKLKTKTDGSSAVKHDAVCHWSLHLTEEYAVIL